MTFTVLDKDTDKEPSTDKMVALAKRTGLMASDIDQFAVTEDGHVILLDDCGRYAYWEGDCKLAINIESES